MPVCLVLWGLDLMLNKFLYRFSKKLKWEQVANLLALPLPIFKELAEDHGMEKVPNPENAWDIHRAQKWLLKN